MEHTIAMNWANSLARKCTCMAQLAVDDQDRGELDEAQVIVGFLLSPDEQAVEAVEPAMGRLNGSIINDKFCLSRAARLRLSWHRARLRLAR